MQMPFLCRSSVLALFILAGCAGLQKQIVPCPLTYSEQIKEVLNVVPKGTRREDALRKLTSAGIEGSFGISRRVYYCELWNRPDGSRWHLNVALLFDETGKFYKTQTADCDVTSAPDKSPDKSVVTPTNPGSEPSQVGEQPNAAATPTR
jgi:hypothetical protein